MGLVSTSFSIMDIEENLVLSHVISFKLVLHNAFCGVLLATFKKWINNI